ncbi:MAG: Type 1 glutamine amidotransferase-like domain-containing protein [Clostridia bacterium]|nr:Type 1 glutamine amidotransferase-like domain-containing protein [Clostridia bacterium]
MAKYILTSMFADGFKEEISLCLKQLIKERNCFAFVASKFEKDFEKTDRYFYHFLKMFEGISINFDKVYSIDGRRSLQEMQDIVKQSDVVWLAGGDSPAQMEYLKKFELDEIIRNHNGVIIGMSAGAINLGKTSICTVSSGHNIQSVYNGLGCVDISVEPHFCLDKDCQEILKLSQKHLIYGLCDESMIVLDHNNIEYYGKIFKIQKGKIFALNE